MIWMPVLCPFPRGESPDSYAEILTPSVMVLGGKAYYVMRVERMQMKLLFSHPVASDSWQPHGPQHSRPLCLSPSPKVCPSSCPLHRWWYAAVLSSDALFSFCPQSFPASGTFPMSQLLASGDQNTGASASVLPMNIQGWFPFKIDWFNLLAVQGTLRSLHQHQFFGALPSL